MTKSNTAKKSNADSMPQHGAEPTTQTLTRASLQAGIAEAMGVIAATLCQTEQRAVADNGKRYPIELVDRGDGLPDGVNATGEIVDINVFAFQARVVLGGIVQKTEWLLEQAEQQEAQQRFYLRSREQALARGEATEHDVQVAEEILDQRLLNKAVALAAFQQAVASYEELTEQVYETKQMKLERERMGKQAGAAARRPRTVKADAFNG